MDEIPFRVIFWIIIGLIYLFTRGRKKAPSGPAVPDEQQPEPSKPMTFEELLREIEGMKKKEEPARPVIPTPTPITSKTSSAPKNLPVSPPREERPLEDVSYDYRDQDRIYQVYEDARKQAFQRPSLEETMHLTDTIVRFKQFKPYEKAERNRLGEEIITNLKDPQSFRKAFIISEILRPKF